MDKVKFCTEYGITPKVYNTAIEMARDVVKKQRKEYIDNAERIIQHYT